ncbi:hypothetical protein [Brachybacterium hainanense]|uniref:Uncharacterized protein n=1 Tax=Brachybacterium hainanense TaxID=1541174 RepID=A0ABV6R792_9MICO
MTALAHRSEAARRVARSMMRSMHMMMCMCMQMCMCMMHRQPSL